ncbi:uncharacterized protein TNCV_4767231, partial [Trichonephila clavipes]
KVLGATTKIELKSQQCTVRAIKNQGNLNSQNRTKVQWRGERVFDLFGANFKRYTKIEELRQRIKCSICYNRWSRVKAERLVLSFPATAAKLPKGDRSTEERFGREDLLSTNLRSRPVNFGYENAATGRAKADLPLLYDELESKLRSLESLGRLKIKIRSYFLTPLVESCLPEGSVGRLGKEAEIIKQNPRDPVL